MTELEEREFLSIRQEEGLNIDPATAKVFFKWAITSDPCAIYPDLLEEHRQIGRVYFARAPGSTIWVYFGDLPKSTLDALEKKGWASDDEDVFPWEATVTEKGAEYCRGKAAQCRRLAGQVINQDDPVTINLLALALEFEAVVLTAQEVRERQTEAGQVRKVTNGRRMNALGKRASPGSEQRQQHANHDESDDGLSQDLEPISKGIES